MTTKKQASIFAIAAVVVALASGTLIKPKERSLPGFTPTETREIRTAVAKFALPRYSQCFSPAGICYLPKVVRIHQRSRVDDMVRGADGVVRVRYTVQYSGGPVSNIVCTVRQRGPDWVAGN